jgi:hypothetical protein
MPTSLEGHLNDASYHAEEGSKHHAAEHGHHE